MIFDITKTVVVNDFETIVNGQVDYIDSKTYDIERKFMGVPINHCDGCGIILPRVSNKNFMIRMPWIKGLLSPFAFDDFCKEHGCSGDIIDIYGKKYNIFKDGIEVIFTKSQFKMNKYFDNWQIYIKNYIDNDCKSGYCNEDEDRNKIRNAKFNYQMLQTLVDMTDEELMEITQKTRNEIHNISRDRKTMLKVFGVTEYGEQNSYLQQALKIYPELLSDNYCREILKLIKKKLVKNARAGKFEVNGKYTFLIPDLYAFCERLFLGTENPTGLLNDGEVYCNLFPYSNELDCLRSPHLSAEHAVRKNVVDEKKNKWFQTIGLYTSTHDLITKIIMADFDGDSSLVCADKTIINAAKRNMKDIVPLYYEMGSAEPVQLSSENFFDSLTFAFSHCNIGIVSNNISKIWNSGNINMDTIKWLTMENNFIIDAAKKLEMIERPANIDKIIKPYIKGKLPHFFIYAKDKTSKQVEKINDSVVNRLYRIIKDERLFFPDNLFGNFRYDFFMLDKKVEIDDEIIESYLEMETNNKFIINYDDMKHSNIKYVYAENRKKLLKLCSDKYKVTDILVEYLYGVKKSKHKEALWYMFGDVMLDNLKRNLDKWFGEDTMVCQGCARRIKKTGNKKKYCDECAKEIERNKTKERVRKYRNVTE